jgi:hypothetical protein
MVCFSGRAVPAARTVDGSRPARHYPPLSPPRHFVGHPWRAGAAGLGIWDRSGCRLDQDGRSGGESKIRVCGVEGR